MRSRGWRLGTKVAGALLACAALLGVWTSVALGLGQVGVPTVPKLPPPPPVPHVPTLPVAPPAPVPRVTTPTPPAPTAPTAPTAPSIPSVRAPTPTAPSVPPVRVVVGTLDHAVTGVLAPQAVAPSRTASPSSRASSRAPTRSTAASKKWVSLSGPPRHRSTTVAFRLKRPGRLVFTLEELWPACRKLATFPGNGRRGVNRVHFRPRVGKRSLRPGTYRLIAKRPNGRIVLRVKLVIVRGGKPTARRLAAARQANACAAAASLASASSGRGTTSGGGTPGQTGAPNPSGGGSHLAAPPEQPHANPPAGGVLGSSVSLSPSPKKIPFLVLALVGLAMLLLGIGALPRSAVPVAAAGALIARRRLEIAVAGIGTFVAAVVAYLLA